MTESGDHQEHIHALQAIENLPVHTEFAGHRFETFYKRRVLKAFFGVQADPHKEHIGIAIIELRTCYDIVAIACQIRRDRSYDARVDLHLSVRTKLVVIIAPVKLARTRLRTLAGVESAKVRAQLGEFVPPAFRKTSKHHQLESVFRVARDVRGDVVAQRRCRAAYRKGV